MYLEEIVHHHSCDVIFWTGIFFCVLYFLFFKFLISDFESIGITIFVASVSLGILKVITQISEEFSSKYFVFFIILYYAGVFLGFILIHIPKKINLRLKISRLRIIVYFSGVLIILINCFFGFMVFFFGAIPDDRIIIAKHFRSLDIIKGGIAPFFLFSFFLLYFTQKTTKNCWRLFLLYLISGFFLGSKGFFLDVIIFSSTIFALICTGQKKLQHFSVFSKLGGQFLILIMVSAILNLLIWGFNLKNAFYHFFVRLISSGDVYVYLSQINPKQIFNLYSPFAYFFHPFTSLFGIRGYEIPIGAILFGYSKGDFSGYGPNAQLPVVLFFFSKGDVLISSFLCFFFGFFVGIFRNIGINILLKYNLNSSLRITAFLITNYALPFCFIDLGISQQKFIGIIFCGILILILSDTLATLQRKRKRVSTKPC